MSLRPALLPALGVFAAAARHQNFAHAAEELHLTASAVSHHVRKLESRLGLPLFQRHARGVSLTAAGRQLADAAGDALTDLQGVLQTLRAARGSSRHLRITTLHSLANTWLMPRLPRFAAEHPDISLEFETEPGLARFDEGGPELGIRHGPGQWAGLAAVSLSNVSISEIACCGIFSCKYKPASNNRVRPSCAGASCSVSSACAGCCK